MIDQTALNTFAAALTQMWADHAAKSGYVLPPPVATLEMGKKFVRVCRTETTGRSAYAFIELETGNILKPAGWKGPAKGVRGNILGTNPLAGCGPYGVAHLR